MARRIIESAEKQFKHYKSLGDEILTRTPEQYLQWHNNTYGTDIASIVMHMTVHMSTQWGIMLQSDLDSTRHNGHHNHRKIYTRAELLATWEQGWTYLFKHLEHTSDDALLNSIQIKERSFTLFDILIKKLTHAAYHTGQIVFLSKMISEQQSNMSHTSNGAQDYMLNDNTNKTYTPIAVAFSPANPLDPKNNSDNQ